MSDIDRSISRAYDAEAFRTDELGFAGSKMGRALTQKYLPALCALIREQRLRARGRTREAWQLLDMAEDGLARRLLTAGVTVCGTAGLAISRKHQRRTYLTTAHWIGLQLGHEGRDGFDVGGLGTELLRQLPPFDIDGKAVLHLTESAWNFCDEILIASVKNDPLLMPTFEVPGRWATFRRPARGNSRVETRLVLSRRPEVEKAVGDALSIGQMDRVIDALSWLEGTRFKINQPVHEFIFRWHKKKRPAYWKGKSKNKFRQPTWFMDWMTSAHLQCREWFCVPLHLEFRGRIYGIPHFNFLREDHVRALFLFKNGLPIGVEGLKWLKYHVAGCADGISWDTSKLGNLNLDERVDWVDRNEATLRRIGETVLNHGEMSDIQNLLPKKNPFQFLAACVELTQALDIGPTFVTHLPLVWDATCNGLQHICAIARALEGRLVNLALSNHPEDFYLHVADAVYEKYDIAKVFMSGPTDRAMIKQPAMSYFYGSRPGGFVYNKETEKWSVEGMTEQVLRAWSEAHPKKRYPRGAAKFARAIYDAIEGMVPQAAEIRDFLGALVAACPDLQWTSPLGMPVLNRYRKPNIVEAVTTLKRKRRRTDYIDGEYPDPWLDKAINAVTANYVHSLDAAHLQMIAIAAAAAGIEMVAVHDCYGCLAPHAPQFRQIIKDQFEKLHEPYQLKEIYEQARLQTTKELPPLPARGTYVARPNDFAFK
jgi:DNA-directed RNA polymerase